MQKINFSAYSELYYSYDFGNPNSNEKPDFNYNHKKHNQLNVNLAYVKASYQSEKFRSNVSLMTGTYVTQNLSSEPKWAKPIFELNLGFKLSNQKDLWIDAGVMPSHIGFESAVGADCRNLTRSILAENSPYYETGIRLKYANKKQDILLAVHLLNGWQRIGFSKFHSKPDLGIQATFKPNGRTTLNYSNFIGTAKPDSVNSLRIFHNFYAIYEASQVLSFIAGLDIGTEKTPGAKAAVWYTPVLISSIGFNDKNRLSGRVEFYSDKSQILIETGTPNGYQTMGASVNYDFQMTPKILWRAEFKRYHAKDAIFKYEQPGRINTTMTFAVAVRL